MPRTVETSLVALSREAPEGFGAPTPAEVEALVARARHSRGSERARGVLPRWAYAAAAALVLAGAPDAQLLTVSYGAERPAVEGHDEQAWAKNRRVDIVALGGPAP